MKFRTQGVKHSRLLLPWLMTKCHRPSFHWSSDHCPNYLWWLIKWSRCHWSSCPWSSVLDSDLIGQIVVVDQFFTDQAIKLQLIKPPLIIVSLIERVISCHGTSACWSSDQVVIDQCHQCKWWRCLQSNGRRILLPLIKWSSCHWSSCHWSGVVELLSIKLPLIKQSSYHWSSFHWSSFDWRIFPWSSCRGSSVCWSNDQAVIDQVVERIFHSNPSMWHWSSCRLSSLRRQRSKKMPLINLPQIKWSNCHWPSCNWTSFHWSSHWSSCLRSSCHWSSVVARVVNEQVAIDLFLTDQDIELSTIKLSLIKLP